MNLPLCLLMEGGCQAVSISIALKAEGSIIVKEIMVIDRQMLADISYRTQLGKSLKNTLRKFDKGADTIRRRF